MENREKGNKGDSENKIMNENENFENMHVGNLRDKEELGKQMIGKTGHLVLYGK